MILWSIFIAGGAPVSLFVTLSSNKMTSEKQGKSDSDIFFLWFGLHHVLRKIHGVLSRWVTCYVHQLVALSMQVNIQVICGKNADESGSETKPKQ